MAELFDEDFLRKLEQLRIISRKALAGKLYAERRGKRTGAGIEFRDHRDYHAGDDVRYLDWGIYGRLEKLLLRLFEEEEDLYLYLLIDCSKSMTHGEKPGIFSKLDYGKRLAAALAYIGLANLDRVSVAAFSESLVRILPPARGRARIFRILAMLRALEHNGETNLERSIQTFVGQKRRKGVVVLISDFYDLGHERGLRLLRHHRFEPVLLQLLTAEDVNPSLFGDVEIVDCETGASRELTVTEDMLRRYRDAHKAHIAAVEAAALRAQAPFFSVETGQPFEDLVLKLFRQRGFLQ